METSTALSTRNLLSISDLTPAALAYVLDTALRLKRDGHEPLLAGRSLALLFEKPSLRTRVSFDVAMQQLGGTAVYLSQAEVGLGQREPVADVARVLSRYVQGIAARTYSQQTLVDLARFAQIPVINALSDDEHPCQALADLLTILERTGDLRGVRLAFIGDGNNVATSLIAAAAMAGMRFTIASPPRYRLTETAIEFARTLAAATGGAVREAETPQDAVRDADVVYTDVWTSMGQEESHGARLRDFAGYQVNAELMALAPSHAMFMHDLPAHRGEETVDEVIEGPQSVVFDQAENRLHAQKAILALLLGDGHEG